MFEGKDAKYAETVEADEAECTDFDDGLHVKGFNENDIPVHQSVFHISFQPFSAINSSLLTDDFEVTKASYVIEFEFTEN